jgi:hypothetical protein
MSPSHRPRARRLSVPVILLAVLASAALAFNTAGANDAHGTRAHDHAAPTSALTARQAKFHDSMRKLWEDHITWTRLAIVSFAGGLPDLQATEARLIANQLDIGNAIKPYYGRTAGNRLTALLKEHILSAVALMKTHLDQTLAEAQHRLQGRFADDIRD